ncbi:MAG: DUF3127 domain-containing protein [Bacteroidaceae bacterium]|nr:DUF3127 domain-containing protein [Bacteroidaceae bacterium]
MKVENILIKRVGDVRQGTSDATGEKWKNRNIVLSWEDEFGTAYLNAVVDDEIWQSLGYKEGDIATLNLRIRTKVFSNGFVANDIRIKNPQN